MSGPSISGLNQAPLLPQLPAVDPANANQAAAAAAETPAAATELPPPSYLTLAFARSSFETLGLDLPRTAEDTTAILSAVQQALEKTVDETRNNRAQALAASFRTAIAGVSGFVAAMETTYNEFITLEASKAAKEAEKAQKETEKTTKIAQSNSLQTQINGKNSEIGALSGQVGTLNGQIDALSGQIAAAIAAGNAPLAAALTVQRDSKITERDNTQSTLNARITERNNLVAQKQTVDAQIVTLTNEINTLANDIATLAQQMAVKSNEFFQTQLLMVNFFALSAVAVRTDRDTGVLRNFERDSGIGRAFENLAETLQEFGMIARLRGANSELLNQLQSEDAQARVLLAAAALLVGLTELVSVLSGLEPTPSGNLTGVNESNGRLNFSLTG